MREKQSRMEWGGVGWGGGDMQDKSLRHNDYGSQALALTRSGRGHGITTGHSNPRAKTPLTTARTNKQQFSRC